jgi:cysteinyl-tRNA synthetase
MLLYNSKTKAQAKLILNKNNELKMYVCGPTVYASPHIGNARSVAVYDLLYRLLKLQTNVTYVRNITDVDDKINKAAQENGETIFALTKRVTEDFHTGMAAIGCLPPTYEPRVTDNIAEIIEVISKLIENGNAYEAEGHVLFDVKSYAEYGALSNRSVDEMLAGARVEVAPYKKNAGDFVLWKPASAADDESAKFESPWGVGRPGWHIECTAMSVKLLGETYDIHGGGADLMFPHHENELAQGVCAHKGSEYAKIWVHNGFLTVEGEKMSKSLGNFITLRELLDEGVNGDVIRWALLSTHYRKPLDWSAKLLADAKKTMDSFYRVEVQTTLNDPTDELLEFLNDDLNISKTSAYLIELLGEYNKGDLAAGEKLITNLHFMGFLQQSADEYFGRVASNDAKENNAEVDALIAARKQAKADKDFAKADIIRAQLDSLGIIIDDARDGTTSWRRK